MERLEVEGVALNLKTSTPIVLLKSADGRVLPIAVGLFEAQAILLAYEHKALPRPMTHDLLKGVIEGLGGKMARLEIGELRGSVYHAALVLDAGGAERKVDCRPSDGIALALRCGAPVFAAPELLSQAGEAVELAEGKVIRRRRKETPIDPAEAEELSRMIESMASRDFWQRLKNDEAQPGR